MFGTFYLSLNATLNYKSKHHNVHGYVGGDLLKLVDTANDRSLYWPAVGII